MTGKKALSLKVSEEVHKKLKLLAVEQNKTMAVLIEEALSILFSKYDQTPPQNQTN